MKSMIPKITKGGRSFKSAFRYYLHDKGADSQERVEWTQTENMRTDDPDKAWRVMAYTAREQNRLKEASGGSRAGRKLEKPVFAYSLAWHPEQEPDREHMRETARKSLEMMGLSEHEALIVAHNDEPQKHVHVIVNRVHPLTGLAGDIRNSKRKFSDFARNYEREHGKIYCAQREKNARKREEGKPSRYCDQIIADAWDSSRSGAVFMSALSKEGYILARGRKRLVVVDPHGKVLNPVRHLEGVNMKTFNHHLRDLDLEQLPEADRLAVQARDRNQGKAPHQDRQKAPPDDKQKAVFEEMATLQLNALQDRHLTERDVLIIKYSRKQDAAKKTLTKRYHLAEQKRDITALAAKVKHAPWWKRLIGTTRKDRDRLRGKVLTYKDAVKRCRETLDSIKHQRKQEGDALTQRQKTERRQLRHQLEKQRESGSYAITPALRQSSRGLRRRSRKGVERER